MINRREFIKYTTIAGVGFAVPNALKAAGLLAGSRGAAASPPLAKFVDALPIPGVYTPIGTHTNGAPLYQVTMRQVNQKLHRDLPATPIWGYDGAYPGNSFVCKYNEPIAVKWVNSLPSTHILQSAIDPTLDGIVGNPQVRATVHVHGCEVEGQYDGGPFSWFATGQSRIYEYPNVQQASTIWYHDHALGITRLNVFAGLAGYFLIVDDLERSLGLPEGNYDIGLCVQDKMFNPDGTLAYPTTGVTPVHPVWVPEFFGDVILVNGKVWPYLRVEPRKYRFRLLNGSQARFFDISLTSGQPFVQIATDGGLLGEPVEMKRLTFAPGERCDVILDFTGMVGQTITMKNHAPAPFPHGEDVTIPDVMRFRVNKPLAGPDNSVVPDRLRSVFMPPEGCANMTRDIVLSETMDPTDTPINLKLNGKGVMDPVTERPALGTTEIWRFINLSGDAHPMHTHLVMFRLLDRRPFDVFSYQNTGQIIYTGPAIPPQANEMGWKDTARVNPDQITRYMIKFVSFVGGYVYHCHILEHEENDMMRPYETVATTYYFAEGTCRPDFVAYLCFQNPGTTQAAVKVTYMLGDGSTRVQTLAVAPNSRLTVPVKDFIGEGNDAAHDWSAKVETTNGTEIICERSMYFNFNGAWTGGDCVLGALSTSPRWYFAEGTCRPDFEAYLCIQNPGASLARVKVTYMLGDATTKTQTLTVPAHSRSTVTVKDFLGEGDDKAHDWSAKVETTNGVSIVAERAMYFNFQGKWTDGNSVVGALGSAAAWYFAEGTCRPNFEAYLCIQNPNNTGSSVKITYMKGDGTNSEQTLDIAATSRATVRVKDHLGEADDAAHDWSAKVETTNGRDIICERPMYFSYNGSWNGGSCVMGSVFPFHRWYFAEGSTRPNFDSYITIMNPDPDHDTPCEITYMLADGTTKQQTVTVPRKSRATVSVKDVLGQVDSLANDFSASVVATNANPIVCERPMYFNYGGAWTGGHSVVGFTY